MCHHHRHINLPGFRPAAAYQHRAFARAVPEQFGKHVAARKPEPPIEARLAMAAAPARELRYALFQPGHVLIAARRCARSEEHTSELQSLMRISYAVFCLKKKKRTTGQPQKTQ